MSFQMSGMQELLSEINRIGKRVDENLTNKALIEGANLFKEKAEQTAPVLTGNLKAHIVVSDIKDGSVDIGPNQQGDAFYGYFLEFGRKGGSRKHGKKKGYKYPPMAARPFMGPTFENNKVEVQNVMAEVIKRELGI